MTKDTRFRNANWTVHSNDDGRVSVDRCTLAVLMDIRDELQAIRRLADCYRIPRALDAITAMHRQGIKRRVVKKRKPKGTK